jgi:hypothetical protein
MAGLPANKRWILIEQCRDGLYCVLTIVKAQDVVGVKTAQVKKTFENGTVDGSPVISNCCWFM